MHKPGKGKTVVVGMSGGVDSSVAAALLVGQGYDVIGVTMKTYEFDNAGGSVENEVSCCGLGAVHDARMVASSLGIPHYVVDFRHAFGSQVVDNFVAEYLQGRTPNPCIRCNRDIKWGELLKKADALGADFIATGHYAKIRYDRVRQRYVLSRGADPAKDQSYALWAVSQDALARTMFPLGGMKKSDVRSVAARLGLRTAQKEESFEICFVPDNDYRRFIDGHIPEGARAAMAGDIVLGGEVVGHHTGYASYTVGQRKNIGAYGRPMYVTSIDSERRAVHIGPADELYSRKLLAADVRWSGIASLDAPMRVQARVRYKDSDSTATVTPKGASSIVVEFDEPKRAITPGQSVVLFQGEDLLGGGVIERALE